MYILLKNVISFFLSFYKDFLNMLNFIVIVYCKSLRSYASPSIDFLVKICQH